jgi:hypothetical protein
MIVDVDDRQGFREPREEHGRDVMKIAGSDEVDARLVRMRLVIGHDSPRQLEKICASGDDSHPAGEVSHGHATNVAPADRGSQRGLLEKTRIEIEHSCTHRAPT